MASPAQKRSSEQPKRKRYGEGARIRPHNRSDNQLPLRKGANLTRRLPPVHVDPNRVFGAMTVDCIECERVGLWVVEKGVVVHTMLGDSRIFVCQVQRKADSPGPGEPATLPGSMSRGTAYD